MMYLKLVLLGIFCSFFTGVANAQAWKPGEQKRAIALEADIKKRLVNVDRDLAATKDADLITIHQDRKALLNNGLQDIASYKARIEAGDQLNSLRYYELINVQLRKFEAMFLLITLRLTEIGYEAFGGQVKEEMLALNKDLRQKQKTALGIYDEAIGKVKASIQ